jgi:hypothetical protein
LPMLKWLAPLIILFGHLMLAGIIYAKPLQ